MPVGRALELAAIEQNTAAAPKASAARCARQQLQCSPKLSERHSKMAGPADVTLNSTRSSLSIYSNAAVWSLPSPRRSTCRQFFRIDSRSCFGNFSRGSYRCQPPCHTLPPTNSDARRINACKNDERVLHREDSFAVWQPQGHSRQSIDPVIHASQVPVSSRY